MLLRRFFLTLVTIAFISSIWLNIAGGTNSQVLAGGTPGSGDANCDGTTNSIDALLVLQVEAELLSIASLPCLHAANVHIDSKIDARDAAPILRFDAGLLDSLPPVPQSILDTVVDATVDLLDVPREAIAVVAKETGGWSNSCMGLPPAGGGCLTVITFGWRITLEAEGQSVIWRIDSTGNNIRLEART